MRLIRCIHSLRREENPGPTVGRRSAPEGRAICAALGPEMPRAEIIPPGPSGCRELTKHPGQYKGPNDNKRQQLLSPPV